MYDGYLYADLKENSACMKVQNFKNPELSKFISYKNLIYAYKI